MSFLFRKVEDVTTISKSQSLTSVSIKDCTLRVPNKTTISFLDDDDCFYHHCWRNNVVVLSRFGTLNVQSFILTEVSDCGLLIVVTSSTFLKRKDILKGKKGS